MKNFILSIFLVCPLYVLGQTKEMDYQNLLDEILPIKNEAIRADYMVTFSSTISEFGGYPDLPFNDSYNLIVYEYIYEFPTTFSKEIIIRRIIEWGALVFGDIKSVLHYQDFDSGKIIMKGLFVFRAEKTIGGTECYQTYIFTVKENKLKLNVTNVRYGSILKSGFLSTITIPPQNLDDVYPISDYPKGEWLTRLSIMKETNEEINKTAKTLERYILDYDQDYDF